MKSAVGLARLSRPGPSPSDGPKESTPRRWAQLLLMASLALIGLFEQLRLVDRFARHLTDEDQTLMWAAAHDFQQFEFRQPNFWGQRYGTAFEAIPVAIGDALGVSPATALPLTLALMGLIVWWAVGLAAWHSGHRSLGIVAVAAPILLSTRAALVVGVYPPGIGRFLAGIALALAVAKLTHDWAIGVIACIGGLAIAFDTSALIVVAPVAMWLALSGSRHWKSVMKWGIIGSLPTLGWLLAGSIFYRAHPDYDLHGPPRVDPSFSTFKETLTRPSEYFGIASLEIWNWWIIPVAVGIIAITCIALTKRVQFWIPALLATAGVLGTLSTSKALDGFATVYFRKERVILLFPVVLWFLWFLVAESRTPGGRGIAGARFGTRSGTIVRLATVLLVVFTVLIRSVGLDEELIALQKTAIASDGFLVVKVEDLISECDRVDDISNKTGVTLAVFHFGGFDRNLAYGCGALKDGGPLTLFPSYERRTWRLHEEHDQVRRSLIVWQPIEGFCDRARGNPGITECIVVDGPPSRPGYAIVRFPPRSALDVLVELGIRPRPFGPDCRPREPSTCPPNGAEQDPAVEPPWET